MDILMGAFIDLSGHKYDRLSVLYRVGTLNGSPLWCCRCDCGQKRKVTTRSLRSENTKSCGCIHKEQLVKRNRESIVHGGFAKKDRLYGVWNAMKQRCINKNRTDYERYGGRGISFCKEWEDYAVFRAWSLSTGYNPKAEFGECTLDRINNDGDYTPDNCRWVNMEVQANNRKDRYQ